MANTRRISEKTGPLWAVFGAPLVGVPLMVGLLALGSGSPAEVAADEDVGASIEQVEWAESGPDIEGDAPHSN